MWAMKILFVSPVGAMFSGAEVSIVNLMKLLVQQGHEVYNVIPDNAPHIDKDYLRHMDTTGIKLFQLKTNQWWWPESKTLDISDLEIQASQQKNIDEVREIIQNEQIELVISNTVNVFQGAIAAACEKVRHFYIIHEFPFGEFGYYKDLIPLIDDLSDKIFVVEGELYHTLTNYFTTDKLIPFIPYTEVQERPLKNSTISRFVSIGGINERKNQLELLAAYNHLNRKDIELVFIGGWDEQYKKLMDDYIRFREYIEERTPIVNNKLSSKYARFLGMKFKNRDIEVIGKSQVVISASNDGLHSVYHEITKERMENTGTIIFQLENEKSLKILLSEFPSSYKKLSLIALEDQREIPPVTSNGIDFEDVLVFFNTHPHILFDLSNSSGNQFQFSYEKESDKEFSRHLFNLHEKHKKLSHEYNSVIEKHKKLSHEYNSVIHSPRWTIPTKILKFLRIRK